MKHISVRIVWSLLIFALCAPLFSQQTDVPSVSAGDISLSTPENTIRFNWDGNADRQADAPSDSPSSFGLLVRMIVALAVVAALIYGVVFLMKRGLRPRASDDPFLRRVSQIPLAPGKSVQVVTLFNHAYLLGVSDNAVNLIGEVTDAELVDSMNLYADQQENAPRPRSFEDILHIFMGRKPGARAEGVFSASAQSATEALRRQRERLNRAAEDSGADE